MIVERPRGVTVVAVLTLLSAFPIAFLFLLFFVLSAVGMGSGLPLIVQNLPYYVPLPLALFAFIFSVSVLSGATNKYLWYGTIVFWAALFLYFTWAYTWMGVWRWMFYLEGGSNPLSWYNLLSYARILFLPLPFIYVVACLMYFLTKTPREYFHVS